MRRMDLDDRKREADYWIAHITNYLLPRKGEWNTTKILDEIERLLRQRRKLRRIGRKSVDPSTPPRTFVQVGKRL